MLDMDLGESMKPLLVAIIIGIAAAGGAMQSPVVSGFVFDIYPQDPGRREALDLCIFADRNFNRLDPTARDACYRHAFATLASTEPPVRTSRSPSEVDLGQPVRVRTSPR
jgi:hypothetical protein